MSSRRFKQIGVFDTTYGALPRFPKPDPALSPGTVAVLEYIDGSHDKILVQQPTKDGAVCALCMYGVPGGSCPSCDDGSGVSCIFTRGYAVSVDNVLEEL